MPRPQKCRKVCCLPKSDVFGPMHASCGNHAFITMTVEEYETIRLIDHEGMMQEACAEKMGVARTTAQRIYNEARKKLAQCLVEGRPLKIAGGSYSLCEAENHTNRCGHKCCHKHGYR